jgi:hypothetical protein
MIQSASRVLIALLMFPGAMRRAFRALASAPRADQESAALCAAKQLIIWLPESGKHGHWIEVFSMP